MMQIITSIPELRKQINHFKHQQLRIGFVPTMGYLHAGHQELIQAARKNCDILVVSIFVNPLQFGPTEDLSRYPHNLAGDSLLCQENQVDILFTPEAGELIGSGSQLSAVTIQRLGDYLCGASRPGHFSGVCTIVTKLFNLVQPNQAYFGQKDIQQLRIIQQMVADLNIPVEIIGVPTVRATDGLALSSRNSYLTAAERQAALIVPQTIQFVAENITNNNLNRDEILAAAKQKILQLPFARLDYLEIVDYNHLQPTTDFKQALVIAVAIFIGTTRLIDNRILNLPANI